MQYDVIQGRELGFGQIFRLGWDIFRNNTNIILLVSLGLNIPIVLIQTAIINTIVTDPESIVQMSQALGLQMLLAVVAAVFAIIGLAHVVERVVKGEELRLGGIFKDTFRHFPSVIATNLLMYVIIGALFMLLIIPGVIWYVYYAFVPYVMALRGKYFFQALRYSKSLALRNWGRVFAYFLLVTFAELVFIRMTDGMATGGIFIQVVYNFVFYALTAYLNVCNTIFFLNFEASGRA